MTQICNCPVMTGGAINHLAGCQWGPPVTGLLRPGNLCPDHGEPLMLLCAQCKVASEVSRGAPTPAMIAAAARTWGDWEVYRCDAPDGDSEMRDRLLRYAEVALRAALTAPESEP